MVKTNTRTVTSAIDVVQMEYASVVQPIEPSSLMRGSEVTPETMLARISVAMIILRAPMKSVRKPKP